MACRKIRPPELSTQNLLVAIVFIAIFTMAVRLPVDTDTWWHLASGKFIIENRTLFSADPFSHTHQGQFWMYPKLAQPLLFAIYSWSGWVGLSLGLALVVTGAFGLVWLITPGNLYIRAFALILGAITSALTWVVRPQMVSFLLAGLLLVLLERYKRQGWWGIYLLPLVMVIWANMHGGFAIAFMLLAVYGIGEAVNRLTRHQADPVLSWSQLGVLLGVGVLSWLAVIINPHGWVMWTYPFLTVGIGTLRDFIQEWRSPDFHLSMTWPFVLMFLLTMAAMGRTRRQVDWTDLALVGLWALTSFLAVRNIGLYGLLTIPALARYSEDVLAPYLPAGQGSAVRRSAVPVVVNWLLLGLVALLALVQIGVTLNRVATTVEQETLPVEAVRFIQETRPAGPMFNSYNWGGYLIFKLWPEYPVYIDGRTDLYEDSFIRDYLAVMAANEGWAQTLDQAGINLVLVESGSNLARAMAEDPAWCRLYGDEVAVVFGRKVSE